MCGIKVEFKNLYDWIQSLNSANTFVSFPGGIKQLKNNDQIIFINFDKLQSF